VRRADALGEVHAPHSTKNLYLAKIPQALLKDIMLVYRDLTKDELLMRCMKQRTQNSNESLHSKVWLRCSKEKFATMERVRFVARGTILDHNFGYLGGSLLRALGVESADSLATLKAKDAEAGAPSRKPKKKRSATPSTEYGAGNF
jgi:hypothetical protein